MYIYRWYFDTKEEENKKKKTPRESLRTHGVLSPAIYAFARGITLCSIRLYPFRTGPRAFFRVPVHTHTRARNNNAREHT